MNSNVCPKYQLEQEVAKIIRKSSAFKCCINCEYFAEHTEECVKYNQRPPARVIAHGCKEWEIEIPF